MSARPAAHLGEKSPFLAGALLLVAMVGLTAGGLSQVLPSSQPTPSEDVVPAPVKEEASR
ncbi:MAG: hypothetical protein ACYCW6_29370 [Candidatus Xenobia bacterium]